MPQKDPEARRAYMREWREKNPDKVLKNQRRYEEQNREKVKEYRKQHYQKNRQKILEREARRYREDPELRKRKSEQARQWALDHPEEMQERRRRSWAKTRYGLTVQELDAILARGCALCDSHDQLQVDHCHTKGHVRAALCRSCNTGLGHFGDDPDRLRAAADYLETHNEVTRWL